MPCPTTQKGGRLRTPVQRKLEAPLESRATGLWRINSRNRSGRPTTYSRRPQKSRLRRAIPAGQTRRVTGWSSPIARQKMVRQPPDPVTHPQPGDPQVTRRTRRHTSTAFSRKTDPEWVNRLVAYCPVGSAAVSTEGAVCAWRAGSLIAYLTRHQSARTPSFHPIFLPSS